MLGFEFCHRFVHVVRRPLQRARQQGWWLFPITEVRLQLNGRLLGSSLLRLGVLVQDLLPLVGISQVLGCGLRVASLVSRLRLHLQVVDGLLDGGLLFLRRLPAGRILLRLGWSSCRRNFSWQLLRRLGSFFRQQPLAFLLLVNPALHGALVVGIVPAARRALLLEFDQGFRVEDVQVFLVVLEALLRALAGRALAFRAHRLLSLWRSQGTRARSEEVFRLHAAAGQHRGRVLHLDDVPWSLRRLHLGRRLRCAFWSRQRRAHLRALGVALHHANRRPGRSQHLGLRLRTQVQDDVLPAGCIEFPNLRRGDLLGIVVPGAGGSLDCLHAIGQLQRLLTWSEKHCGPLAVDQLLLLRSQRCRGLRRWLS